MADDEWSKYKVSGSSSAPVENEWDQYRSKDQPEKKTAPAVYGHPGYKSPAPGFIGSLDEAISNAIHEMGEGLQTAVQERKGPLVSVPYRGGFVQRELPTDVSPRIDERLSGVSRIGRGYFNSPAGKLMMLQAFTGAPLRTTAALLAGIPAQMITQWGAQRLGAGPGTSQFTGDLASILAGYKASQLPGAVSNFFKPYVAPLRARIQQVWNKADASPDVIADAIMKEIPVLRKLPKEKTKPSPPFTSASPEDITASRHQNIVRPSKIPVPPGAAPGAWEIGPEGQVVEKAPAAPESPWYEPLQPILKLITKPGPVPVGTGMPQAAPSQPPWYDPASQSWQQTPFTGKIAIKPGPVPKGTGMPQPVSPQPPWWDPASQTWQQPPLTGKVTAKPGPVPTGTGLPQLPQPPWWEPGGSMDWQAGTQAPSPVQPLPKAGPVPQGTGIPTELPKPPQWWEPGGSAEFPGTQTVTPSNKITAQPGFVPKGTGLPVAAPKLKDAAQQAAVDRAVKEIGFTGPKPLPTLEEIKAHTPEQWEPHYQEMLKRVEEEGGHGKHGTDRVRVARNKDYGIAEYLKEKEGMSVDKWEGLTEAEANKMIDKLNESKGVRAGEKGSYKRFGSNEKAGTGRSSAVGRDHVGKALRVLYGE
jgi:hypothetical protein